MGGLTPVSEKTSHHLLSATDAGISFQGELDDARTYDVVVNGLHVWSLQPPRDMRRSRDAYAAPWPKALRGYLEGTALIELRDHVTGDQVDEVSVRLGTGSDPISVRNKDGRPLILDKWGRMIVPLESEGSQQVDELLRLVSALLDELQTDIGVPAYIAYGTLLGAVRDGALIGHDNDVDLAYVSSFESPVDIVRENFRIQRALTERGWLVRRGSGSRLNVRLLLADGSVRHVDIFTAFWIGETFHTAVDIGCRLSRADVLPLSSVELCGHAMPAPADPSAILAAAYGEGWRIPDPAFQYDSPTWLKRRFSGFFGGLITHRKRWDAFHASRGKKLLKRPSSFARWVADSYPSDSLLVDAGCGGGRDSRLFARRGRAVLGVDYSLGAVLRANRWAARRGVSASFEMVNFYDLRATLALGARLSQVPGPVDVYARFLLHALEDRGRENFWRVVSMSLRGGGRLFLEFRTDQDARRRHFHGKHFRRFLEPSLVVSEIEAQGGKVLHLESGTGLAPFETEDPHVCRIVASWP